MSAEQITYDLETEMAAQPQPAEARSVIMQPEISRTKLESGLVAIYGRDEEAAAECLETNEAIGLLNQAAKLAYDRAFDRDRISLRNSFHLLRADLYAVNSRDVCRQYGITLEAARTSIQQAYSAMRSSVIQESKLKGRRFETPRSVMGARIIERSRAVAKINETGFISATNWRAGAVCTVLDTELFFTGESNSKDIQARALAKMACLHCPVRQDCLGEALEEGYDFGFWGGIDEKERRAIKRRNKDKRAIY